MRVQVDDARHQREPAGIDDLGRVFPDLADRSDVAILNCNVGADRTRSYIGISFVGRLL
jgi:hypothetical protein